jgi:class 3 adenylate cyclase
VSEVVVDAAAEGRAAYDGHDWESAYTRLAGADASAPLPPADLERLAGAARWSRRFDSVIPALERAEALYTRAGDLQSAARVALALTMEHYDRGDAAQTAGCFFRADRHLTGLTECREHGFLAWQEAIAHLFIDGDTEAAMRALGVMRAIGERLGDPDLEALGLVYEGHAKIIAGQIREGLAQIDRGAAVAMAGAVEVDTAGTVYCSTIFACRNVGDWRRAAEWTEASLRWCERERVSGFPGLCRLHRAEVMRLRGDLEEAERDALAAAAELLAAGPVRAGWAFHELGEVRRRRGNRAGAREAFGRAFELGFDPQPGLALLELDEREPKDALRSIGRALSAVGALARESRPFLLPVQVSIAVAAGELDVARAAIAELTVLAQGCATTSVEASLDAARGEVALADGDVAGARESFRRALHGWQEVDAPYEAARVRVRLADVLRRDDDATDAQRELEAAIATFERIGAVSEAEAAASRLARARPGSQGEHVFVFTDIVGSTSLVEAMGDDAWETLLQWHDRTVRALVSEHGGAEVKHEGDGFFLAFDEAGSALSCAAAVQRALAGHRRDHGFAPAVRIGVHRAQAIKADGDFRGRGVHTAARIAAAAGGGEVLVSTTTLPGTESRHPTADRRELRLKGLSDPVEVATLVRD